jgi:uncharacterized protein YjbJ (UPF0337 family)
MGQSPFAKKGLFPQGWINKRRSTRIDFNVPVVLTGRDASGQPFREETETLIVNLHGAKVRTSRQVLVGMMVTVENARSGASGKAICVQVHEPPPGETTGAIAIQLVHPGNIWGVENPPADWEMVAAELGGRPLPADDRAKAPAAASPQISALPAPAPPRAPEPLAAAPDVHLAGLEKRATQIVDAALQSLPMRADDVVTEIQRNFHQQLEVMVKGTHERLTQGMEQIYAQLESALQTLKNDALADMTRDALQDFEKRLEGLAARAEARVNDRTERASSDVRSAVETLKTATLPGLTQDVLQAFEKQLGGLVANAEGQVSRKAEQVVADLQTALETFRSEAMGDVAREAVGNFEQRIAALSDGHEKRITQRVDQAFAELEAALVTFRSDLGDELAARQEQVLKSTEQALRARVAAMLSTVLAPGAEAPVTPQFDPPLKK